MYSNRELFLKHVAQTSPSPIALEIVRAEGVQLYDLAGKPYVDLISGFSVMNLGHGLPQVKEAISQQTDAYMHLMVYGELIQTPQVAYANLLTQHLPQHLDCVYFTNSGAEATEGAMKLAKRVTGRTKIIACNKAYHGSTQGALSIMGGEYWRQAYRPLLPEVYHFDFNSDELIDAVDCETACVVTEVVQAEAGVITASADWLIRLKHKCETVGAKLVFDEIQTGFGRTGSLFAFEHYGIAPDILLLGKALGGGLPLGAFISTRENMWAFTENPVLGHISTFAGHPVCCAAGMASFKHLLHLATEKNLLEEVIRKSALLKQRLRHPKIKRITNSGLLMALQFSSADECVELCHRMVHAGFITDWFLFAPDCMRISPPLVIDDDILAQAADTLLQFLG